MRRRIPCLLLAAGLSLLLAACVPEVSQTAAATSSPVETTTGASPSETLPQPTATPSPSPTPGPVVKTITLSFAGDCTIGSDPSFGSSRTFDEVFAEHGGDYGYFFKNVRSIFEQDDLTIVNLETTFTTATAEKSKPYNFKGDPSYVNILLAGGVDIVNLANNHTMDFLERGYTDTQETLKKAGIGYYGYDNVLIREVNGLTVGFAGFCPFDDAVKAERELEQAMQVMADQAVDLRVVTFHWGIETDHYYNASQTRLAKKAIDLGANLVVGHHPHVLQGIEQYKGAYIVYSLANFVFGGNRNPKDKDSMITRHTFTFTDGHLSDQTLTIFPVQISSRTDRNDYQPFVLEGDEAARVLGRIEAYSH
jgi:poly-gamma-glutamate capsule biosynthesis protein CapA/YwtB (metallophosphatase superfamily)